MYGQDRNGLINWDKKRETKGNRSWRSETKMYEFSIFRYGYFWAITEQACGHGNRYWC